MIIEFNNLFFIYLLLFLAGVAGAWIYFVWQRRRCAKGVRRFFICGICGEKMEVEPPKIWVRCEHCGARQEFKKLKEI